MTPVVLFAAPHDAAYATGPEFVADGGDLSTTGETCRDLGGNCFARHDAAA